MGLDKDFSYKKDHRDLPGGPVAKTALPRQGAKVQSLIRDLDPTCFG